MPNGQVGRNGKYESHVQPRLETIKAWRRRGQTQAEVADNLAISVRSLEKYKVEHKELAEALMIGKDDADALVENALFKRAMGYEYEEVETIISADGKARVKKIKKQVAPDVTAQIFYLKNRRSQEWRDRKALEHSGPDGEKLDPVVVYLPTKEGEGK